VTSVFEDHLNLDAIVAFADGEMSLVAYQRASAHLQRCSQCAAEVREQQAARSWLRSAGSPTMPLSLFDALKSIPTAAPLAGPVEGLTVDPQTGRVARTFDAGRQGPHHRGRRFRLGAGALVAGLAVGAMVAAAAGEQAATETLPPGQSGQSLVLPATLDTP
jgi:anti-sigma factor RsiW